MFVTECLWVSGSPSRLVVLVIIFIAEEHFIILPFFCKRKALQMIVGRQSSFQIENHESHFLNSKLRLACCPIRLMII